MASFFWLEPIDHTLDGHEIFLFSESHEHTANASNLTIMEGKEGVADNISLLPTVVSLQAKVANTLLRTGENRARKMCEALLASQRAKRPIRIVTTLRVYEKAFITNLTDVYDEKSEFVTINITAAVNDFVSINSEGEAFVDAENIRSPLAKPPKNMGSGL